MKWFRKLSKHFRRKITFEEKGITLEKSDLSMLLFHSDQRD